MLARTAARQSRVLLQRRAASTTSEAANAVSSGATKAKEATQDTVSKASQGLSRVTSSAGPAISKAAGSVGESLSKVGGRTGRLISFVNGLIPPTIYYARVAGELGKIIAQGRGMAPPNMQTVQSYLQPVRNLISNPSSVASRTTQQATNAAESAAQNPQTMLTRLRSFDRATMITVGVVAAETLGFFSIGEIIGRFKIVGYRGGNDHGHH